MRQSNAQLKGSAREILLGKYGILIAAFLLSDLISYGLSALIPMGPSSGSSSLSIVIFLACSLIIYLLTMILSAGSNYLYLNIGRENPYRISDIFYCFTHQPDKVILLAFRLFLIDLGCMLPFLAAVTAAMMQTSGPVFFPDIFFSPPVLFAALLSLLLMIFVPLRYAFAFYLCLDQPWLTPGELMALSRRLMQGQKRRYFLLQLSFLGMGLLVLLSLGLGLLWVQPYVSMTNTLFYLEVTRQDEGRENGSPEVTCNELRG